MVIRVAPLLVCLLLASGCSSVPVDVTAQAREACALYNELRPDVIAARKIIVEGFEFYPPKTQEALRRIDARLPQLDAIGRFACGAASNPPPGGFDWQDAESILREVAPYLALLKQSGVIG